MKMNFGSVANISTNATSNYLKPWNIYDDVKFDGISDPVSGNTKDGGTWRAWDFTFTCPQGIYRERVFEPQNDERMTVTNSNGHESQLPSAQEKLLFFAMQLIDTYNPDVKDKFIAACAKINGEANPHKQFDLFFGALKKAIEGSEITAQLLLTGRKSGDSVYASLPNFVRINSKTNEPFTSERFIGHNLGFSAYEAGEKKKYDAAAPTNMDKVEKNEPKAAKGDEIDNFDSLL